MKIDFNASYRDVAALVGSSDRASEVRSSRAGFGKLLASISPDRPQQVDKPKDSTPKLPMAPMSPQVEKGPMAMLGGDFPSLIPPRLEPSLGKVEVSPPVKEGGSGVKTPALFGLRRVPANDQFSRLSSGERAAVVGNIVQRAGLSHKIDPSLGMSVAEAESSFNPVAVSSDGFASKGLFQLLDSTGREMHAQAGLQVKYNPFDPQQNVHLGVGYLRKLHDIFSRATTLPNKLTTVPAANSASLEKLAVAAFNAGEGRVAAAQQRAARAGLDPSQYDHIESYLPDITKKYVVRVMQLKGRYADFFSG
ncbi:MAG: transglycosylase SLT domain-containing protein [Deltaproteobacteria bacterium]|nr:transglycosylase SLT domain-containing protein [Deltaproteobacteria bacterium]